MGNAPVKVMYYSCPRCAMNCQCSRCVPSWTDDDGDDEDEENEAEDTAKTDCMQVLEYIYRFWFNIRDELGHLNPCLLESDVAQKFLNNISAFEFYTVVKKRNEVYNIINNALALNQLFTIDSYRLREPKCGEKLFEDNNHGQNTKNRPKIFYKIVDLNEID